MTRKEIQEGRMMEKILESSKMEDMLTLLEKVIAFTSTRKRCYPLNKEKIFKKVSQETFTLPKKAISMSFTFSNKDC